MALRVHIYEKNSATLFRKTGTEVDGGYRFAATTFLVGN
jgi:hypothetical protein